MSDYRDISGTTEINSEGIKKHFKSGDPWQPLFELVWNGFDAKAETVSVNISRNPLGGLSLVEVLDDGDGIDPNTLQDTFGRFNDSHKREDAAQHGAHGRGRLAFHRLCRLATWHTKSTNGQAKISVDSESIKRYTAKAIPDEAQCVQLRDRAKGTHVALEQFTGSLPSSSELQEKFAAEFGWHLALHASRRLILEGEAVLVPRHELTWKTFEFEGHKFDVQIIQWDEKPSSEKSYLYLLNAAGRTVYKQLSTLNNKANFFASIYVTSAWADKFAEEQDLINPEAHTPNAIEWKRLLRSVGELSQSIYEDFLRRQAVIEVERYEEDGMFPTYSDLPPEERTWRLDNAKKLVRTIYVADPAVFNAASKKQRKIIIRLLDRLSVSNENDSLVEVLNSVLELDDGALRTLADQLKQTTLENIISTIEVLQRRISAAGRLRALMNNHYRDVLETPDLQKVIENNTWLFGPAYETLGAEEDTFTRIAKELRDKIPLVNSIDADDVDEVGDVPGAQRQVDLFLARRFPVLDSNGRKVFRCVIVEIKRPSVALNVKHLRQLDDYANIIKKHPEFSSEHMRFELILVGRKISPEDTEIPSRLAQQVGHAELGLVSADPRMKRYVLNWYTLLDSFELSAGYLLDQLRLKRTLFEGAAKEDLLAELQAVAG